MDILTHIVSGIAVSSVIASFLPGSTVRIITAGAAGGAFPDIDAISLWSKFDSTFGKLFKLGHSGKEIYFGKFWYSHHGFFHSVAAAIMVSILSGCLVYFHQRLKGKNKFSFESYAKNGLPIYAAFISGSLAHAAGDIFTPSSVWGGIRLFWPMTDYVGGLGKIWWWNNYDIFLIATSCVLLNMLLIMVARFIKFRAGIATSVVATVAFICSYHQIETRKTGYAYTGHTVQYKKLEQKSMEEQQRILGKKVYRIMRYMDDKLPVNF